MLTETVAPRAPAVRSDWHRHAKFIEALGGARRVSTIVAAHTKRRLSPQAVSQWKIRGIPHKYRPTLGAVAAQRSIPLPPNFYSDWS